MKIQILLIILCSFSCSQSQKSENERSESNNRISRFLKYYPDKKLPIDMQQCDADSEIVSRKGLDEDLLGIVDSSFHPYCQIRTNYKFYTLISMALGDCFVPVLTTFDYSGREIDQKVICIGKCGGGPCFSCSDHSVINKDYSIYCADTISESECDSANNEIPGTNVKYVLYQKGKIMPNGKITLTHEKRLDLN